MSGDNIVFMDVVDETPKKGRFSFLRRGSSGAGGGGHKKRNLLFGILFLGGLFYSLLMTELPLQLWAATLKDKGLHFTGVSGSVVDGIGFQNLEVKVSDDTTLSASEGRLQLDLWSSLTGPVLHIPEMHVAQIEWNQAVGGKALKPASVPVPQLRVLFPVLVDRLSVTGGKILDPRGETILKESFVESLRLDSSAQVIRWGALQVTTSRGDLMMTEGEISESQWVWTDLKARLTPELFPDFFREAVEAKGNLKWTFPKQAGGQLDFASGKVILKAQANRLVTEVKDLNLSQAFAFEFPLEVIEARFEVPLFSWHDPKAWSDLLAAQLPKMKLRYGPWDLNYDPACDCLKDEEFRRGFAFQTGPEGELRLKLTLNEYPPEPAMSSNEELLALTAWGKSVDQLDEKQKAQLAHQMRVSEITRPPELPSATGDLLSDFQLLQSAQNEADAIRIMELIRKSAKTNAPLPVLYFASLLKSGSKECDDSREWLAEIGARGQEPSLLGKAFALLSQCENDPSKQKQLAQMAQSYLPKDPYIRALLHRIDVEHFSSKKVDLEAQKYLKSKGLEKDLALMVIEGFLRRAARAKSLATTLFWAKKKHQVSGSAQDLSLVKRLQGVAKNPPAKNSRRPASKP